ncbi:hypothetical protein [Flavobacterium saccharophilum]|uniref:Uncharacterized protein n=1 Tax=Flavobacterium saccharophilum TaxID=29534 RepID=A0A1M7AMD8_9FLAO|nr:hypothetical protein [Flavobacterium saccharophilum]SHL43921.1 hypothetical protein SAMN05444366_0737 [Flavobacterium saccharophilum]
MKKLFFSAIALVAFSVVSTAKNVEEKKAETKEFKETVRIEDDNQRTPCDAGWIQAYENAGGGAAGWAAGDAWASAHNC